MVESVWVIGVHDYAIVQNYVNVTKYKSDVICYIAHIFANNNNNNNGYF